MLRCDTCANRACVQAKRAGTPRLCPSKKSVQECAREAYRGPDHLIAVASHAATYDGYPWATRVEEIMLFAARAGYTHIGLAFCITLASQARVFGDILRDNGFTVSSVLCKTGAFPREMLQEPLVCKMRPGMAQALCNPVGQALLLNEEHTDLNVVLGLCVGHDSLFFQHATAPCTYLVVKDRACNHEPLRALREHTGSFERIHHLDLPQAVPTTLQWRHEASAEREKMGVKPARVNMFTHATSEVCDDAR